MEELKITKGKWKYEGNVLYSLHEVNFGNGKVETNRFYCSMYPDNNSPEAKNEVKYNIKLAAEAGNIAIETGLTPKQILEQRDELLKYAKKVVDNYSHDYEKTQDSLIKLRRTINSIQKATNK